MSRTYLREACVSIWNQASGADAATIQAAWERAYAELAWADTLAKGTSVSPQAKFLMGVAALSVGQGYLSTAGDPVKKVTDEIKATKPMPDAAKQKAMLDKVYPEACANTNKANDYFVVAQLALPAGASFRWVGRYEQKLKADETLRWIVAASMAVMVVLIATLSPPCSQSASVRFGKPRLPWASVPWQVAQLLANTLRAVRIAASS